MIDRFKDLDEAGQAVWLDFLHRRILDDGEQTHRIADEGHQGVTSNPSIFEAAIGKGADYDNRLRALIDERDADVVDLYERLAIADIQDAADQLLPTFEALNGTDGFVSLEVSPYLANDTAGTLIEARRLWRAVDRPNLMIKVPGTGAGVPAIQALISEGINVNVTLLFGLDAYLAVAEAHIAGLEAFKAAGGDLSTVHGVASFFVSRIDGLIDKAIDTRLAANDPASAGLNALRGKVAIANAKNAYQHYLGLVATPRWQALAAAGAAPQRLLWASTGTKDPAYSDVLYVENLIGRDTVNTLPPATLAAFGDHGVVRETLTEDVASALAILADAERLSLDLHGVTDALVVDGVEKFAQSFDALLGAVAGKRATILGARLNGQSLVVPETLAATQSQTLARAAREGWTRRLWAHDANLWTGADESQWLGWLAAGTGETVDFAALEAFQTKVKGAGYRHALLLGMGGSSLGPEVLAKTLGSAVGFPELLILDSTDPAQVARTAAMIDPATTLFIVASKSGSTLEPDVLHRYFWDLTQKALGADKTGAHFIAITDPGSKLEANARADGFAQVFLGDPGIGGRYSVLSPFGVVPAAIIGLDIRAIFAGTAAMVHACGPGAPPSANPGFALGILLGVAAQTGRDKITLIASPGIDDVGAWLEQLIAESTGKIGKGLIPVDGEPLGAPGAYGADRLFAYLRLEGGDNAAADAAVQALEDAGHPVARITLANRMSLFQEFFRWEIAVAVAGAVIGVDPFDQPDVEAAKIKTSALTDAYEASGALAAQTPFFQDGAISLYTDPGNISALKSAAGEASLEAYLRAHFARVGAADYIGLLAYLDRTDAHVASMTAIRTGLRGRLKAATVVGFGPRFQHSTGQAYKGGPNAGVFLQITAPPAADLPVPGRKLSFGVIEAAQAQGDFDVLAERGRRILRVDLGADVAGGLARLAAAIEAAISRDH